MTTLATLHRDARARLSAAGIADAALDARILVEDLTGTSCTDLLSRPDTVVPPDAAARLSAALARRIAGEPVHRILGAREFYGLRLTLAPDTLEPRPDTETLVDVALPHLARAADRAGSARLLDLGTGTGAVALSLLSAEPRAQAVATDIAPGALAAARANAVSLGLAERAAFVLSDWFDQVTGRFDIIVSNPPYIPSAEIESLAREVREHDPRRALDGGVDGLDPYRIIARGCDAHLAPGGVVAVEIGAGQGPDVTGIFAAQGYRLLENRRDLAGHERALAFGR